MAVPIVVAVNQTVSDLPLVNLSVLGSIIPGSGVVTLTDYNSVYEIQADSQLRKYVEGGDVLLRVDGKNYTQEQSEQILTTSLTFVSPLKANLSVITRRSSRDQRFAGVVDVIFDEIDIEDVDYKVPDKAVTEIVETGRYLVQVDITADIDFSTSRTVSEFWIERRSHVSRWYEVKGLRAGLYHRTVGYGVNTGSVNWPIQLDARDQLRVRIQRTNGLASLHLRAGACRFSLIRIG